MSSHYVPHTRIPTLVFPSSAQASRHVALMIESLVRQNNSANRPTVLGLATGSTPVGLYRELIRLHKEASLDLSRVVTFNLDEYYPMGPEDDHAYHLWMHETFFKHVNIKPENIHIPDGTIRPHDVDEYCARYEQQIRRAGGIDLQILGIGRSGHIGFNEPGSTRHSRTRLVTLDPVTRRDAASDFFGEENVPHQAITMGVGTILEARKVVIMAFGEHKAPIVHKAVEGEMSESISASFLQKHPDTTFILDQSAAGHLTPVRLPWVMGSVNWTPALIRRAASLDAVSQVIAANVDLFGIVTSANQDLNPRRIERYLAAVWESGASPMIVLNKVDLVADVAPLRAMLDEVVLAVPVVEVSAITGDGLSDLQAALAPGKTVAFIGSSGVGKSSLVNRLLGRDAQHVSSIRQDDARGRHTTTRRELLALPTGAVLIDTPGMRELGLTDDASGVDTAFADISELAAGCRFNDCRHEGEPGCAVRAALGDGTLSEERWENYRKLQREVAAYEARQDPVLAAERRRQWKMITKAVRNSSKVTGKPLS